MKLRSPKMYWVYGISTLIIGGAIAYSLQYTATLQAPQLSPGVKLDSEGEEITTENSLTYVPVISDLTIPWSIVFPTSDSMYIAERPGRIQHFKDFKREGLFYRFEEVSSNSEEGLMGLELDPNYPEEPYVYASYAYQAGDEMFVKVVRLTDENGIGTDPVTLLDEVPAAQYHAGSRLRFGPDGKLYVTTGDAVEKEIAQDLDSLGGKILRMNKDGSIPEDNPFPNSFVYSYGHRNPQGIDFDPVSGTLFSTEHGPSVFDGPAGGDEFNRILPGENYGWPLVSHQESTPEAVDPLLVYTPAVAPASGVFYDGDRYPGLKNAFLFGGLRGEGVYVIYLNDDRTEVDSFEQLDISEGRIREIAVGPDGFIYFTTSNTDGRGEADPEDDRVFQLRLSE
jgi:glucose/arabinose dehydrogenase